MIYQQYTTKHPAVNLNLQPLLTLKPAGDFVMTFGAGNVKRGLAGVVACQGVSPIVQQQFKHR